MENLSRKQILVALLILISIFFAFNALTDYITSFQKIKVTYRNVSDIKVYDISNEIDGDKKIVEDNVSSGDELRLRKGHSYLIEYQGWEGYEGGQKKLQSLDKYETVTINPSFSREKLEEMLNKEIVGIHAEINNRYSPAIGQYEIQRGTLFDFGEWYGTTLKYKGADIYNSDTLRMLLHKEDGRWVIKTDPPAISLSKYIYRDVPEDILRRANSL